MKKLFLILTLVSVGLSATQCTKAPQKKALVTYFSATGTTRAAAEQLAEIIGADIFEIKPTVSYSAEDLDWRDSLSRSFIEMHDLSLRPRLKSTLDNIDEYDVIYIGFPIWWDMAPTIINSFIDTHDLTGKTVVPFATSGGSSIANSCQKLQSDYPELTWKEGLLLNEIDAAEIEQWTK